MSGAGLEGGDNLVAGRHIGGLDTGNCGRNGDIAGKMIGNTA